LVDARRAVAIKLLAKAMDYPFGQSAPCPDC